MRTWMAWSALALLLPGLSLASLGTVSVLEGTAKRPPREGPARPLQQGTGIVQAHRSTP